MLLPLHQCPKTKNSEYSVMADSVRRDTVGSETNVIIASENAGETGADKEAPFLYPMEAISTCLSSLCGYDVVVGLGLV